MFTSVIAEPHSIHYTLSFLNILFSLKLVFCLVFHIFIISSLHSNPIIFSIFLTIPSDFNLLKDVSSNLLTWSHGDEWPFGLLHGSLLWTSLHHRSWILPSCVISLFPKIPRLPLSWLIPSLLESGASEITCFWDFACLKTSLFYLRSHSIVRLGI